MSYDTTLPIRIFIGYDPSEHEAYEVCKASILRAIDLHDYWFFDEDGIQIEKLYTKEIEGWYREREPHQSTDFTYTRFLVPYLTGFKGIAIFVDCDFVFLADPREMVDLYYKPEYAIHVVKHPQYVPRTSMKMDGKQQHSMPRKNWASLIMFNCEHPKNKQLTFDYVNEHMPGKDMHQFTWLEDNEIGSLPLEWNCLDDYYYLESPKAIHYTDGGPWFENYTQTMYSDKWYDVKEWMLANVKNEE